MCLQFMPKVLQNESEIKAALDHKLVNLRTINKDPRAASHDMVELKSSFDFEPEVKNMRTDQWWRAGQVLTEVNPIPGFVSDK